MKNKLNTKEEIRKDLASLFNRIAITQEYSVDDINSYMDRIEKAVLEEMYQMDAYGNIKTICVKCRTKESLKGPCDRFHTGIIYHEPCWIENKP